MLVSTGEGAWELMVSVVVVSPIGEAETAPTKAADSSP
jgi:hypothetical protein